MNCHRCNAPLFKNWVDDYFFEICINLNCEKMNDKKNNCCITCLTDIKNFECQKSIPRQTIKGLCVEGKELYFIYETGEKIYQGEVVKYTENGMLDIKPGDYTHTITLTFKID